MKSIKLLSLKLTNFKGIKDFEFTPNGNNAKIYGDNATGKTTNFDAFMWLLFNKDSDGNTKFDIKTLDEQGKVMNKLNHEVEASLLVDGKQLTLKKVFKEKWTKPRGKIDHVFGGHTTDYFVNGVPSAKKEFDVTVADIVDEDVFRLLTDTAYFNDDKNFNRKKRREILFEIAGDLTDEDVIASNGELSYLIEKMNGNSVEDHKKVIMAKRKEIRSEIDTIPVRIDEVHRSLPDISGLEKSTVEHALDKVSSQINEKNEQINKVRNGSEVSEIKKKISDIELNISMVRNEHERKEQESLGKLEMRLQEEKSNLLILQNDVKGKMQLQKLNERQIKSIENELATLREHFKAYQEDYKKEDAVEFNVDENCTCPTCKQDLPADQVDEATENFNLNKSQKLEGIKRLISGLNEKGPQLNKDLEEIKESNETIQKEIDKITTMGKEKNEKIELLENKISEAKTSVKPIEENEQYLKLQEEKVALENKIAELERSTESEIVLINKDIEDLKSKQGLLQRDIEKIEQVTKGKTRIAELEEEEKALATEYEELEKQLYLTEEFTRTKVNMLTENIDSKFKYARFNLFEELINGGHNEICETTYNGVPYSSLNNAARINVGLDIINTLSEHYGVRAPIFIDNAESVTKLIDIDSQVISLIVNEYDKELRVVTETDKESEVA